MAATDTAVGDVTAGTVPVALFPLNTVLFPGGRLNLKVFEARYLDLVGDCLRQRKSFGVVGLRQGAEAGPGAAHVRFEQVGVWASIDEVDSEQAGILRVRCTGGRRFRLDGDSARQPDGLWLGRARDVDDDEPQAPAPAMAATVRALAQAIAALKAQGNEPFAEPYRLDDAGWVANRWCELLPIPGAAKQRLMELDDPGLRLQLVDEFLRGKGVVRD